MTTTEQVGRNEWIAMAGGALLLISLFLPWYATSANRFANIDGQRGSLSAWEVHGILRWLFVAAALAPFILTYIIVRGHKLSWPRGELTAVIGITAAVLILYSGLVDKPGTPSGEISLKIGWFVALLGSLSMFFGSAVRASEFERPRKPPGTI
jgi:hypothetical protein